MFVLFGGRVFQQTIGISMGTNCAPLLADLFLHVYEADFLQGLRKTKADTKTTQTRVRKIIPRLKQSLQKFYGLRHVLVDCYEISISQMSMDLLLLTSMFSFLYHCQDFYQIWLYIWVTRQVSYKKKQELFTLRKHLGLTLVFFTSNTDNLKSTIGTIT